jgi:hypothetical protein
MGTAGVRVSIDAVAEVKIQTNLYAAETGRTNGGVINVITKSARTNFTAAPSTTVRRGRFDSRTYFATVGPGIGNRSVRGSLGGPLKTNRTFFFADYEGYRLKEGQPNLITVPTTGDAARRLLGAPPEHDHLRSNDDAAYAVRRQSSFPRTGSVRFARQLVCALYPTRTTAGLVNNFSVRHSAHQDSDTVDFKIDHHFNHNDSAFVRYRTTA